MKASKTRSTEGLITVVLFQLNSISQGITQCPKRASFNTSLHYSKYVIDGLRERCNIIERDIGEAAFYRDQRFVFLPQDSHYQVWVLTKHLTKMASFVFLVQKNFSLALPWKHLYTMFLHVPMQFLIHTHQLSCLLYKYIFIFSLCHHSLIINFILLKKERWGGENQGIRICIFSQNKAPLNIKDKGIITQVLVMFCLYFGAYRSYLWWPKRRADQI